MESNTESEDLQLRRACHVACITRHTCQQWLERIKHPVCQILGYVEDIINDALDFVDN